MRSPSSGRELSEFLSAIVCQNSPSLPKHTVISLFRDSTRETVFCPFPTTAFSSCLSNWLRVDRVSAPCSREKRSHQIPPKHVAILAQGHLGSSAGFKLLCGQHRLAQSAKFLLGLPASDDRMGPRSGQAADERTTGDDGGRGGKTPSRWDRRPKQQTPTPGSRRD